MVTHTESQLREPYVANLIQTFQERNIPILGFTAIDTSVIPKIGSVPAWRAKELKKLGINFTSSVFPKEQIKFKEFPSFHGTFPLYKDGILYSNVTSSKGDVLKAFLTKICQTPSRIIFVDDSLENLQSVEKELQNLNIPYLGIHYRAQVDLENTPKVSENEWKNVWDQIHERAKDLTSKRD